MVGVNLLSGRRVGNGNTHRYQSRFLCPPPQPLLAQQLHIVTPQSPFHSRTRKATSFCLIMGEGFHLRSQQAKAFFGNRGPKRVTREPRQEGLQ